MRWIIALTLFLPCQWAAKVDDEELAVLIEFGEFDLEDACIAKNNALVRFYNGSSHNLAELLENEIKTGSTLFNLSAANRVYKTTNFSSPALNRKLHAILTPGSALLGEQFSDYAKYAVSVTEAGRSLVRPTDGKNLTYAELRGIFGTEDNASRLAQIWNEWACNFESHSGSFEPQLEKLRMEAEKNGFENVESYWLHQSEITLVNYEATADLWLNIAPLYQKLRQFIAPSISSKFGREVFVNSKLIPAHVLGSFDSTDWVATVDSLDSLKHSKSYSSVREILKEKKAIDLYKDADETTAELRLGYLPDLFFKSSQFQVESENCAHYVDSVCKTDREYSPRVLTCKGESSTLSAYLQAHEEVARIKHVNLTSNADKDGKENGFLFREGLSDSVLYEAIATAASLLAIHPENLHRRGILPTKTDDANMTFLLVAALHIIPALPYHLAADKWRLAVLAPPEEVTSTILPINTSDATTEIYSNTTTDSGDQDSAGHYDEENNEGEREKREVGAEEKAESGKNVFVVVEKKNMKKVNVTEEWWAMRAKLQGIGSADGELCADYLADNSIIWNKPHISKFLGPILLFQILEQFKGGNTTENLNLLQQILRQGKSQPWEALVGDLFNITEIRTEPFLRYFKPLEVFLDNSAKFSGKSDGRIFAENDFRKLLVGASAGEASIQGKEVKSASEDSNALLVALTILGIVGASAVIFTVVRKRLQKKRQARRRRKLDLMS